MRPLLFGYDPGNALLVGAFFTLYILLTQVVLQNVVVAVLLDKFVASDDDDDDDAKPVDGAPQPSEADLAVLRQAAEAGLPPPPPKPPTEPPQNDGFDSLRTQMAALVEEQLFLKTQLHLVLQRLPQAAVGAGAFSPGSVPRSPADLPLSA